MIFEKKISCERFSIKEINQEVADKYDPEVVAESLSNTSKMTKVDIDSIKKKQIKQAEDLAKLMNLNIDSKQVQAIVKRHHNTNEKFYKTSAEMYKGLGDMYVSDVRFTEFYDKHKPGLAKFLRDAMHYFADTNL